MSSVWIVKGLDANDSDILHLCRNKEIADQLAEVEREKGEFCLILVSEYKVVEELSYCVRCHDGPLCNYEYFHCASCMAENLHG